ncbi:MAG: type III-B CRISPR module RAMP protein Cmr6 [Moraxellaceae bacterium]|jgi:CRISPR-associated protein Cmr6|nr:type III-B CRISPR module RAMP protein Cmr6 [Moraxellaceae bacterium]
MVALMRASLRETVRQTQSAHAGLLLTHSLPVWEKNEKTEKSKLINKITGVNFCSLYKKAFERWLGTTCDPQHFFSLSASLSGRLMMALSTGGAIETGMSVHHTYGMPMIAGSSVKGAVRAYAESIGLGKEYIAALFGADEDLAKDANTIESAGYLVWHDAWWIPEGNSKPFVGEVVTVHHQDYYGGSGAATDFDSPIPNQQLAVQGSFYFVIEGDTAWTTLAIKLLTDTLEKQGIGTKRAAGYGFMKTNQELNNTLQKQQQETKQEQEKNQQVAQINQQMETMTDNQKQIVEFKIKLLANTTWQNGNVGADLMGFGTLAKTVETWTDIEDIKFAIIFFEEQLPKWLKKPIKDNKNWKDKINSLKRKAGLIT